MGNSFQSKLTANEYRELGNWRTTPSRIAGTFQTLKDIRKGVILIKESGFPHTLVDLLHRGLMQIEYHYNTYGAPGLFLSVTRRGEKMLQRYYTQPDQR